MAAAISKTVEITKMAEVPLKKKETVYERLQRLTEEAERIHGKDTSGNGEIRVESIDQQVARQKDKVMQKVLLHVGPIF